MKNLAVFIIILFMGIELFAQAPNSFRYQAVARDNAGNLLSNQNVSFRISILLGSTSGTEVYRETHTGISTNSFGLIELNIGNGSAQLGSFGTINWGDDSHYVKVEMDPNGGTSFQVLSTSQLLSVPYALHAETANNVVNSPWTTSGDNIYRTSGNVGIGTTSPVTDFQIYANRDALFGASMAGNGSKLIWDYSSRAFRAGYAAASSWNEDSIGLYSAAFGFGSLASAYMSFSHGFYTHARTYAGFSIGRYNVGAPGTSTAWTTSDPLFEVGNGTSNTNRNNAFTIRKDGRVGINDATPDYLLDIENPEKSLRSIYINHDITSSSSTMYGIYVNADNTASNSGLSYAAYFDMTNNNDDAYGSYSLAFCDAFDGSPAYGVRAYADNDNGSGWAYAIYGAVSGSTTGSKYAGYFSGNVYTTGAYLPSDKKLKTNLKPFKEKSMEKLMKLQVTKFQYKNENFPTMKLPTEEQTGLIAQDVELLYPELVKEAIQPAPTEREVEELGVQVLNEDISFKVVDYTRMVPHLIKAMQELQTEIENLKQRISELEN